LIEILPFPLSMVSVSAFSLSPTRVYESWAMYLGVERDRQSNLSSSWGRMSAGRAATRTVATSHGVPPSLPLLPLLLRRGRRSEQTIGRQPFVEFSFDHLPTSIADAQGRQETQRMHLLPREPLYVCATPRRLLRCRHEHHEGPEMARLATQDWPRAARTAQEERQTPLWYDCPSLELENLLRKDPESAALAPYDASPNTHIAYYDASLPGALPVGTPGLRLGHLSLSHGTTGRRCLQKRSDWPCSPV
jgi:hypothetical protein